jgi:hypothetical protein
MTEQLKSLVLYASQSGNTEKVAMSFKKAFERNGWQCDSFKIDENTDIKNPPFKFEDYHFCAVGSYVFLELPAEAMINLLCKNPYSGHCGQPTREEVARQRLQRNNPKYLPPAERPPEGANLRSPGKIIPGPQRGVVFATYSGMHLGPKEAYAALAHLEVELEHLGFKCVGSFCCPGKQRPHGKLAPEDSKRQMPETWHKDIDSRPNERDLLRAELFMEDILENQLLA